MADYDYIIVGSGFGGSVAALRLAEKGYKVLVLEAGRRFRDQDFAKTSWDVRRFLFWPLLGLQGIMRFDFFRGLMIMSGAGVGGGSLVYANTLIEPSSQAFKEAQWPTGVGIEQWDLELKRHYDEAKRMLGVTEAPVDHPAEVALREAAHAMGYGDTFHPVHVGVYLGKPGVTVPDPYFGGAGPERAGCLRCGGCMIGCRHNAKNTLMKNYLYFAERRGVEIRPGAEARVVRPLPDGSFEVTVVAPGWSLRRPERLTARGVILAAGVLGTLRLMLRCRDEVKTMPHISSTLGTEVRTNSESIVGVRMPASKIDYSSGVAIAAGVNPDVKTKIEAVRYPKGSDVIGLLTMPLLDSPTMGGKAKQLFHRLVTRPILTLRGFVPFGFARETVLLLVMQTVDSKLTFRWRRRLASFMRRDMTSSFDDGIRPPVHIPEGNALAEKMAAQLGGGTGGSLTDLVGMSVTAHVLGGCPMGKDASTGVIGSDHQVHGYPGLYVVGGAAVPANLGVNPSLTIAAMAERAIARIPAKSARDGKVAA